MEILLLATVTLNHSSGDFLRYVNEGVTCLLFLRDILLRSLKLKDRRADVSRSSGRVLSRRMAMIELVGILLRRKIHLQKKGMRYSNWVNDAFYQMHPCVHRTVINRFKNYCFSIQMEVASGFQGLDSVGRDAGNEVTKERRVRKWRRKRGGMQKRGEREWQPC